MFATSVTKARENLIAIQAWKYWLEIEQVAKREYGITSEEFQLLLLEYQRFLALALSEQYSVGMFSDRVDKLWHAHILHTTLYEAFCQQFNNGKLLHHVPNLHVSEASNCTTPEDICTDKGPGPCKTPLPDPPSPPKVFPVSRSEHFLRLYTAAYGTLPSTVWNLGVTDDFAVVAM